MVGLTLFRVGVGFSQPLGFGLVIKLGCVVTVHWTVFCAKLLWLFHDPVLTLASALRSSVMIVLCAGFESSTCDGGGLLLLLLGRTAFGRTTSIPLPFGRWIVVRPLRLGNKS